MSTEAPSNSNNSGTISTDSSAKRHRTNISTTLGTPAESTVIVNHSSNKTLSPLESAKTSVLVPYVETLHHAQQPSTTALFKKFGHAYAAWYWKNEKHTQMMNNKDYVPASCKVGLDLNATPETKKSEDYTTLCAQKDAYIVEIRSGLAAYAKDAHALNVKSYRKTAFNAFCQLLFSAVNGHIAKLGINPNEYSAAQACMDLFALKTDECTAFLAISISDVLRHFKRANDLAVLPEPTVPYT